MTTIRVGYHANSTDGKLKAIKNAQSIGANAAQIWLGNPKAFNSKLITADEYRPVREHVRETDFFLISHSPYLLNFARPTPQPALDRYLRDLQNISKLGGRGSVLHMGCNTKDLKQTFDEACDTFIENLRWIISKAPKDVVIILENMAGGGTRMCCEIAPWAAFWGRVPDELKPRIKWCIDTAHLFAAGEYNLCDPDEVQRFYDEFSEQIGWEHVLCFHYNGSKSKLGSHVDNHADIGAGLIDDAGMRAIAQLAARTGKPLILEVPCDEIDLVTQLGTIDSWQSDI